MSWHRDNCLSLRLWKEGRWYDHFGLCCNRRFERLDRVGYDGTDYSVRQIMNRVAEYKYHAQECREQAKRMQQREDRDALERLAQIWEKLADVREQHPELELEASHSLRLTAA